jgi:hypothetical protein
MISGPQTFRTFWHGEPLGPYQLLCMRSFVDLGHRIELYCYDDDLAVPHWVQRRSAHDILPTDRVLCYQSGFGQGSPSLHANRFRYALLHRLGGWWIDIDVVLLRAEVPAEDVFFAREGEADAVNGAVIKFPRAHPLLVEAIERCVTIGDGASWGQTGPRLINELAGKHDLFRYCKPWQSTYPIHYTEVSALFDPQRCDEVGRRCAEAWCLHLYNEVWRGAGVPRELGPPAGSFLDRLFADHDIGIRFRERMRFADVARWIANRNGASSREEADQRIEALNQSLDSAHQRLAVASRSLESSNDRLAGANQSLEAVLNSASWRLTAPLREFGRFARWCRGLSRSR